MDAQSVFNGSKPALGAEDSPVSKRISSGLRRQIQDTVKLMDIRKKTRDENKIQSKLSQLEFIKFNKPDSDLINKETKRMKNIIDASVDIVLREQIKIDGQHEKRLF
jgi:hypothetical protein